MNIQIELPDDFGSDDWEQEDVEGVWFGIHAALESIQDSPTRYRYQWLIQFNEGEVQASCRIRVTDGWEYVESFDTEGATV